MEPSDYPVLHFQTMGLLAQCLKRAPAQILESAYSYESFGSWVVIFRHRGKVHRLQYDGKDGRILLERSSAPKRPYGWELAMWNSPVLGAMELCTQLQEMLANDHARSP
jgi:hypothetical protein